MQNLPQAGTELGDKDYEAIKKFLVGTNHSPKRYRSLGFDEASLVQGIRRLLSEERKTKTLSRVTQSVLKLFEAFHFLESHERKEQILGDFKNLQERLDRKMPAGQAEEVIMAAATTSDPQLLIKTGALHSDSSCQHYTTGGKSESLLGYVKDANVKLLLQKALSRKHFAAGDYELLKVALSDGTEVITSIEGPGQRFVFDLNTEHGWRRITSLRLELFDRRHVLKLGETAEGDAGLYMERAYRTPNDHYEEQLTSAGLSLLWKVADAIGARTGVTIQVAATRNALGVYSDRARGIQNGPYQILAELLQARK